MYKPLPNRNKKKIKGTFKGQDIRQGVFWWWGGTWDFGVGSGGIYKLGGERLNP